MSTRRPHLILITTDQQRGDCLGLAGHPVLSTPNLDELGGSTGAYFPHAYSEVPSCIPARRLLLSGQNQVSNGMIGYAGNDPDWQPLHTLPGELGKAGYQTHLIGKLHLGRSRRRFGFDSMDYSDGPVASPDSVKDDYHRFLRANGIDEWDGSSAHGVNANGWIGRPYHLDERLEFSNWCVTRAANFLECRDPSVPFFLNISFHAPHPPLTPPAHYFERYMDLVLPQPDIGDWVDADVPEAGRGAKTDGAQVRLSGELLRRCRAAYYGMINHVDDQIGRLCNILNRMGLFNDCLFIFTSDHGEMLGDHHMFRKTFAYEASARVPFIIKTPHWMECRNPLRAEQVVGLQDVMPTMLDAAGIEVPDTLSGKSLLPILRGENTGWRDYLHGEHSGCYDTNDAVQFVTDGQEKFIWYTQTGKEQFFDLRSDPNECRDLIKTDAAQQRVSTWRQHMIDTLRDRTEGFVANNELVAGRPHGDYVPGYKILGS